MKRFSAAALSLMALGSFAVFTQADEKTPLPTKAEMDKPVRNFKAKDIMKDLKEGEPASAAIAPLILDANKDEAKPTVIFFVSESCPVTWRYEKRVGALRQKYGKNVRFVGVSSSYVENPDVVRKWAEQRHFEIPILRDADSKIAVFFGVRQTPTMLVVDKDQKLRYQGGIDDDPGETNITKRYVADALDAVLAGKTVPVKRTLVPG
jgi:peroxiredoxin